MSNTAKNWVISDLHLGHKNILKFAGAFRGGSTPEEHDEWIVQQWNSVVGKGDTTYILGDVATNTAGLNLVSRLNGQKILVRGNHDTQETRTYLKYFVSVHGLLNYKGTFWMSHAPIHPMELRNRPNLHGHVHQRSIINELLEPDSRYINCCVEMTYGVPQDLDALLEKWKPVVAEAKAKRRAEEMGSCD